MISSRVGVEGVVVALAGRRIDAEPAETPRFPYAHVPAVRDEIRSKLASVRARVLVCSAACGADLLALGAAQELGMRTRVVLPFAAAQFRKTSVVDRPRPEFWGKLFDDAIAQARARNDVVELDYSVGDDAAYSAANRAIVTEAKALARDGGDQAPIAMIVWDGPRSGTDATQEFADLAEKEGFGRTEVKTN